MIVAGNIEFNAVDILPHTEPGELHYFHRAVGDHGEDGANLHVDDDSR